MLLYVLLVFTSGSATTLNLLSLSVAFLERVLRDLSLFEVSFLSSLFMFWVFIWTLIFSDEKKIKNKKVTFNYLGYLGIILVLHSIYLLIIQFNSEIPNIYGFEINEKLFFINFLISLIVLNKSGFLDD